MKTIPSCLVLAAGLLSSSGLVFSQEAGRQQRAGEVITPADRSERWQDRLQTGQSAPEFTLPLADAKGKPRADAARVSLAQLRAEKPVVLIFGSVTCPPFRRQLEAVNEVFAEFRDRAEFLFVYIREAHPDSVLKLIGEDEQPALVKVPQAGTLEQRLSVAATCGRSAQLDMPIAVDDIDNRVGRAYAGWPNRMVVVDTEGRVAMASAGAPNGVNAAQLRLWLNEHLPAE